MTISSSSRSSAIRGTGSSRCITSSYSGPITIGAGETGLSVAVHDDSFVEMGLALLWTPISGDGTTYTFGFGEGDDAAWPYPISPGDVVEFTGQPTGRTTDSEFSYAKLFVQVF